MLTNILPIIFIIQILGLFVFALFVKLFELTGIDYLIYVSVTFGVLLLSMVVSFILHLWHRHQLVNLKG